jgi:hypothetical protein
LFWRRENAVGLAVERAEPAALSDRGKQIGQMLGHYQLMTIVIA